MRASTTAPVLIGGSDSSGTTFLSFSLDRHPAVASMDELYLFNKYPAYADWQTVRRYRQIIRRVGISSNPFDPATTILSGLESYGLQSSTVWGWVGSSASLGELTERFLDHICSETNAVVWIEKTPSNVRMIGEYLNLFPNGRFIHLVRDPRDVFSSLARRHPGRSPFHGVETWLLATSAMIPWRTDSRVLEMRYEDLVTDYSTAMQRVCQFLDIEYAPRLFESQQHRTRLGGRFAGHSSWQARPDSEPSPAAAFRWKTEGQSFEQYGGCHLTAEMARLFGTTPATVSELALEYGYEPFDAHSSPSEVQRYRGPNRHRKSQILRLSYDRTRRPWTVGC